MKRFQSLQTGWTASPQFLHGSRNFLLPVIICWKGTGSRNNMCHSIYTHLIFGKLSFSALNASISICLTSRSPFCDRDFSSEVSLSVGFVILRLEERGNAQTLSAIHCAARLVAGFSTSRISSRPC